MNRVWIYIISKELKEETLSQFVKEGNAFVTEWTAHENRLTASFEVFKNRIVIVRVNENINSASGCSIDKLTRFIKASELSLDVNLLDRFNVAVKDGERILVVRAPQIPELLASKKISQDTIIYNTSASTETELEAWENPLGDTWLRKYLQEA